MSIHCGIDVDVDGGGLLSLSFGKTWQGIVVCNIGRASQMTCWFLISLCIFPCLR